MKNLPFLAAVILACYSQNAAAWGVPKHYLDPWSHPPAECPKDTHIWGRGIGKTQDEAREKARADVLRNIDSTIETETERVSVVLQKNMRDSSQTSLKVKTIVRSSFGYGQKVKDLGKVYKKGRQYYALACLNKLETAQEIWKDAQTILADFDAQYSVVQTAMIEQNRPAFSRSYKKCIHSIEKALPLIIQLQSVGDDLRTRKYLSSYRSILMEAERLRTEVKVSINLTPSTLTADVENQWAQILRTEFEELGVAAGQRDLQCEQQGGPTHVASLDPKSSCRLVVGNHLCNLSPTINIQDCQSGEFLTVPVQSDKLFGANSRKQQHSVRQAAANFNRSLFREELQKVLVYNIPIQSPK
ncbi:MAG: LPP20 family lipoprotein [Myxococcota bacterium]|nr:LPP20 family lipoprotein [Myxococcota bacterium]